MFFRDLHLAIAHSQISGAEMKDLAFGAGNERLVDYSQGFVQYLLTSHFYLPR